MSRRERPVPDLLASVVAPEPWALRNGRWIVLVGGALTTALGLVAVFVLPDVDRVVGNFVGGDLQRARADARSSGLAIATGVGVATAGLLTWGRLELSRRQHQLDRLRDQASEQNAARQFRLAEQSQRNERLARSIELLGHSDYAVRLGALHALEGLAKDGYEPQAVYDIICAFARLRTPKEFLSATVEQGEAGGEPFDGLTEGAGLQLIAVERGHDSSEDFDAAVEIALRADPKLEVRRNLSRTNVGGLSPGALSDCNFRGAVLTSFSFVGAKLSRLDFGSSKLYACDFTGAVLTQCRFSEAQFVDCNFDGAVCDLDTAWPTSGRPAGIEPAP